MPLRSLVQKEAEDRNLEFYPNHNTPSTSGGFNYGNSRTPIFDGQFRQRKYKFGDAGPEQAYDRPGGDYSREPFMGRNIPIPDVEEDTLKPRALGFINSITDGLIRGGVVTATERAAIDVARYGKFLISNRGISYLLKNVGLQRTNPVIRKLETDSVDITNGFDTFKNALGGSNSNQRVFNLGINVGASILGAPFGLHIKREGVDPTSFEGYIDDIDKAKENPWSERFFYVDASGQNPSLITSDPLKGNRLINLFGNHILGMVATEFDVAPMGGGMLPEGLQGVLPDTDPMALAASEAGVDLDAMSGKDKIKEFLGGGNDLGRKELYSFSGGAQSLYGLGNTTIFKASTLQNTTGKVTIGGVDILLNTANPWVMSEQFGVGYVPKGQIQLGYSNQINERTYLAEDDPEYDPMDPAEDITVEVAENTNQGTLTTAGGLFTHPLYKPQYNTKAELKDSLLMLGGNSELLKTQINNIDPKYASKDPTKYRPEDKAKYARLTEEGQDKFMHPQITLSRIGDFRMKKRGLEGDPRFWEDWTSTNGPRHTDVTKYSKRTSTSNAARFYREERVNLGNPGKNLVKGPGDAPGKDKFGNETYSYDMYDPETVDKINALDIFNNDDNAASFGQSARDLIRFRIEALDGDNPTKSKVMVFRAFLDDWSDNFSGEWNSFKYNGRAEDFYTYAGFNREISFGFKIAAQSRHEMMPLYRKLNYLVSQTAPEYKQTRMRGCFCRLTVGSMWDRIPGFFTSVGLQIGQDSPWEITVNEPEGGEDHDGALNMPHVMEVKCAFTPIHTFIPQRSTTKSPFILPTHDGLRKNQKWYSFGAAANHKQATIEHQVQQIK